MATKVTYTLDDETVQRIRRIAERTRKAQSLVVREAVAHYAARDEQLTPEERERQLQILDEFMAQPGKAGDTSAADVEADLEELRRSRRQGWSRRSD